METATTPGSEEIRATMHAMWNGVAPAWAHHATYVDARAEPVTDSLLDGVALRPGDRVLELGAGAGGLGLAAAERLGADGRVAISDVAPAMVEAADGRARERGRTNVETKVLDIERIDEPDASYDVVLCRDGLQFAADPARGAREMTRVLRPGGRLAVATWASKQENPWLGVLMDAFAEETGRQVPPPGMPGPFALDDPERLQRIFNEAGLTVAVEPHPAPMRVPSFEDWWERTVALAGPVAGLLRKLPQETVEAVRDRAREGTQRYATEGGIELPGVALLATGARQVR